MEGVHEEHQQAHVFGRKGGMRLVPVIIGNGLGLRNLYLEKLSDEKLFMAMISLSCLRKNFYLVILLPTYGNALRSICATRKQLFSKQVLGQKDYN
jgi:hypothetical protein